MFGRLNKIRWVPNDTRVNFRVSSKGSVPQIHDNFLDLCVGRFNPQFSIFRFFFLLLNIFALLILFFQIASTLIFSFSLFWLILLNSYTNTKFRNIKIVSINNFQNI